MNKGVEILLERMKEFPDEFVDDNGEFNGRWGHVVHNVFRRKKVIKDLFTLEDEIPLPYLNEEEIDALANGLVGIHRDRFTADIIEELGTGAWLKEYTTWHEERKTHVVYENLLVPMTQHKMLSDLLRQEIEKTTVRNASVPTEHPNKTRMDKLKKAGKYRK